MSDDGLVRIKSKRAVKDTIDSIEGQLAEKGIRVFARVDHAADAALIGMPLRATLLLIFGNPKGGTPLMQSAQRIGIDLPLKMLCWQDEAQDVWLAYNDMQWLSNRHQLGSAAAAAIEALARLLAGLAAAAAT